MDIDTQKLQAYGLSAADVVNAVGAQNIILPAGDVKIGHVDYQVETNSAPDSIAALNDLPIKTVNGATDLRPRRRQRARRIPAADQHRARRRAARRR